MPCNILFEYLQTGASGQGEYIWQHNGPSTPVLYNLGINSKEYYFGVRKIWEIPYSLRPFWGGGFSKIYTKGASLQSNHGDFVEINDSEFGIWLDGGVYLSIINHFNLGFEYNLSSARTLYPDLYISKDKGGARSQYRLLFGLHF